MRIVLTGAGTGGHIYPLVAVATEINKQIPDNEMLYIGTRSQMYKQAEAEMARLQIPVKNVMTGKMRRYFSLHYFIDFFRIPIGIVQSLWILLIYMPDAVFSKGGYASVPVVIAAWIYRIPVLTHEGDAMPGWANRVNGKMSRFVALTFAVTQRYFAPGKTMVTGNPMRKKMKEGDADRARAKWKIESSVPVVFFFGGSQGARNLNTAAVKVLPELTKVAHVLHMAGKNEVERTRVLAGKKGFRGDGERYTLVPYLERDDMADAYALADVIVARPGASTITEIAANKKVALFVPHGFAANDHLRMNAFNIAEAGAATVLDEDNMGEHIFAQKIEQLLRSNTIRKQFSENISAFYHEDAAKKIVTGIIRMLEK